MSTPITATTIAEIAGVTVTAVGQWRRRDATFPQPMDPSSRPAMFDHDQVIQWLTRTGRPFNDSMQADTSVDAISVILRTVTDKLHVVVPAEQFTYVLSLFAAQRHIEDAGIKRGAIPHPLARELDKLDKRPEIRQAYALMSGLDAESILSFIFDRAASPALRSHGASTQVVNDLLAALAPESCTSIIDVACGTGGTLDALRRRFPDAELAGNDVDALALASAQARALVSGWNATWFQVDALAAHSLPGGSYDLVCTVPPWNARHNAAVLDEDPQRWHYGTPNLVDDTAWLQVAHHLLQDNGTAILILPPSTFERPSTREVMNKLTSDRSLQAIIELPGNLHNDTNIKTVAVVITKNSTNPTSSVLFAQFDEGHITRTHRRVKELDTKEIVAVLRAHRAGEYISTTETIVQVDRLDLINADKSYNPQYWIDHLNAADPGELRLQLRHAADAITPVRGIGGELGGLTISDTPASTINVKEIRGFAPVRIRPSDERDAALRAGDICIGPRGATVCTADGTRPDRGLLQAFRCDSEQADPWFLAAVFTSALHNGGSGTATGIPRVNLRLVDVPVLTIQQQRDLGAVYRETVESQRRVEEQAQAWRRLSLQVAGAISSGLAATSE
ncbi:N-6 DNA methylase [Corynebacterium pacaense]|uniref:N-6 DNA methylase n=1 Tax=Corynebacterium pacaense TaxID=1816684 RepID=UPI0009BC2BAC|nr:N-6 DNA methylase [Corynebacterium pacaense]